MLAIPIARPSSHPTVPRLTILIALLAVCVVPLDGSTSTRGPGGDRVEVVVRLTEPALAYAHGDRAAAVRRVRVEQAALVDALARAIPTAVPRWRYRIVTNGMAIVLPESELPRLHVLPGVRDVLHGTTYTVALDRSPGAVEAPAVWGPALATAGQGIKIGIIDDGVDQTHPFFSPSGFTMPPGFPRGQVAYTTAKVIVARAFAPPGVTWAHAGKPFDPELSGHGTHVAGIAAGNAGTTADAARKVSGIAPRAYIGNYKALTVPTDSGVGLDGNAPEIVAAIEAAVADGMDVINLSIGEPEVEPTRDLVALALDGAAAAGVVPVVAAGNDFQDFGRGTVASPGSSRDAITVAAVSAAAPHSVAGFSSAGPTALSLRAKPDVAAPGIGILSSVPGGWASISGTSMAAPHVAGGAALLLQRHPDWSPATIKAALIGTARPVPRDLGTEPPTRVGAGLAQLSAAANPMIVARPSSFSLGLVAPATTTPVTISLDDAGGGAGTWDVTVLPAGAPAGTVVTAPAQVAVPGQLALTSTTSTAVGEAAGVIRLSKDGVRRRIPYWFRVDAPALVAAATTPLAAPGVFRGDTRGQPALVDTYRYPEVPAGGTVTAALRGPEQLFRVTLPRDAANFGVVVLTRAAGSRVEPRVVVAGNENRLTGAYGLPINLNPYLVRFRDPTPVAGALKPRAGSYDVVFDSATAEGAGAFTFRFWVDDVTPPTARLVSRAVRRGTMLRIRVGDGGSGVDPTSITVRIDGRDRPRSVRGGVVRIATGNMKRGKHTLRLQVSDYQETRNDENVARILPNTRVLRTSITIR